RQVKHFAEFAVCNEYYWLHSTSAMYRQNCVPKVQYQDIFYFANKPNYFENNNQAKQNLTIHNAQNRCFLKLQPNVKNVRMPSHHPATEFCLVESNDAKPFWVRLSEHNSKYVALAMPMLY